MNLFDNQTFHIYNQGNNGQQVFYDDKDYELFLWKMKACLLPFGDLVAYCLMTNHFHWLFHVRKVSIDKEEYYAHYSKVENKRRRVTYDTKFNEYKPQSNLRGEISLNEVIGILLSSYSKSINRKYQMSGSVFRKRCKANDGWVDGFNTIDERVIGKFGLDNGYIFTCFQYIHNNPVDAGMVREAIEYKYSSARDYAGIRKGTLVNIDLGKELLNFI